MNASASYLRLNPFEIRAGLLRVRLKIDAEQECLNPFEIRAGLLLRFETTKGVFLTVLIPSKSGLGCYRHADEQKLRIMVLIPSKSGLGCYRLRLRLRLRPRRLNPFEIRAGLLHPDRGEGNGNAKS